MSQITVSASLTVSSSKPPLPKPPVPIYRVFHDYEVWQVWDKWPDPHHPDRNKWLWRIGVPEVFNLEPGHVTTFSAPWQRLAFALNPGMKKDNSGWRQLYDDHRAFTNHTGFDSRDDNIPPNDNKRDYINGWNLRGEQLKWDNSRLCGGASITGTQQGDYLLVDTLRFDSTKPNDNAPTIEWMIDHPWYSFRATTIGRLSTDKMEVVGDFPQNPAMGYCLIPLVTTKAVKYPLAWLQRLDDIPDYDLEGQPNKLSNGLPDPYKIFIK